MKKLDFWRTDGFLSVVVVLSDRNLMQRLERGTYDQGIGQHWAVAVAAAVPATGV